MKQNIVRILTIGLILGAVLGSAIPTVSAMACSDCYSSGGGWEFISSGGW